MGKCAFCQIVASKREAYKIYEDENTICLLDKHPISKGHCLIIPKKHFENLFDIDIENLKCVTLATKNCSTLLKKKLNARGINVLHASGKEAQQSVFHFHLHLVPRYKNDKLNIWPKSNYKEKSLKVVCEKVKN